MVKRFYLSMGAFLAALTVIELVLCHMLNISQHLVRGYMEAWPIVLVCVVASLSMAPFPRVREAPILFLVSFLNLRVLCVLPMLAERASRSSPLCDRELSAIDALMGLHTSSIVHVMRQHPNLNQASTAIYWTLLVMMALAALVPPIAGRSEIAYRYIASVAIGVIITTLTFLSTPAIGPWTVQGYAPDALQSALTDYALRLRSAGPVELDLAHIGLVSFPSFHCTGALLAAYALSCFRWLRWPAWIMAGLICVSAITTGAHYTVDVLGGVVLTYPAILIARWVVPIPAQ